MNFIRMSVAAMLLCLAFACNSSSTSEWAAADNAAAPETANVDWGITAIDFKPLAARAAGRLYILGI